MNKTQKGALYGILLSLSLAGIVIFDLIDTIVSWPIKLLVALVWGGFLLVPIYLIEKKKHPCEIEIDERDKAIIKKATLTSLFLIAIISCLAFTVCLFTLGLEKAISFSMNDISAVIYFILVAFILVLSITILIQYGRGAKGEQS